MTPDDKVEIPAQVLQDLIDSVKDVQKSATKIEAIEVSMKSVRDDVEGIRHCLQGNPLGNDPGLTERVRVLEKTNSRRDKLYWILVAASIGLLANAVKNWMDSDRSTSDADTGRSSLRLPGEQGKREGDSGLTWSSEDFGVPSPPSRRDSETPREWANRGTENREAKKTKEG